MEGIRGRDELLKYEALFAVITDRLEHAGAVDDHQDIRAFRAIFGFFT